MVTKITKDLRTLVQTENVLLHGSRHIFHEIRPHLTDGEMAVCATPYPEIATPMAILTACTPGLPAYILNFKILQDGNVEFGICYGILNRLLNTDPHA